MALNDLPLQTLHLEQSLQTSLHNSDFDVSKVLIRDRLLVTGGCEHTCPFKRTHRILGFCRFLPLNIVPIVCPPLLLTRVLMGHMNSVTVHFHVSWSFIRSGISNLGLHMKVARLICDKIGFLCPYSPFSELDLRHVQLLFLYN